MLSLMILILRIIHCFYYYCCCCCYCCDYEMIFLIMILLFYSLMIHCFDIIYIYIYLYIIIQLDNINNISYYILIFYMHILYVILSSIGSIFSIIESCYYYIHWHPYCYHYLNYHYFLTHYHSVNVYVLNHYDNQYNDNFYHIILEQQNIHNIISYILNYDNYKISMKTFILSFWMIKFFIQFW
jgi:hypothetical protein